MAAPSSSSSPPRTERRALWLALVASLAAAPAAAHPMDVGSMTLRVRGAEVEESLFLSIESWRSLAPGGALPDGLPTDAEAQALLPALFGASLGQAPLRADGEACELKSAAARPEGLGVRVVASGRCARPEARKYAQRLAFLAALPMSQRIFVAADLDGATQELAADRFAQVVVFDRGERRGLLGFVVLGIEHIFTGFDHLVFLLGLLLMGGPIRRLVGVVSAFTVAHSITLAVAALGVLTLPSRLVESAIAASIMYVAVENFLGAPGKHRWIVAFLFGLVHGFGFASALRDAQISREDVTAALFGFNVGVEAGQVALVVTVAPLLALARRRELFTRWGLPGLSLASLALGAYWFVGRAF